MAVLNLAMQDPKTADPNIKYRIWVARVRDEVNMADFPKPDETMSITATSLKMLTGKAFHFIDCIPNTIKPNAKTVGEVAPQGQLEVPAEVKGIGADTLKFLYDNNGEEMILIWEHCETGKKFIAGNDCGGVKFTYTELGMVGDFMGAKLSFKGYPHGKPFYFFTGDVPITPAT